MAFIQEAQTSPQRKNLDSKSELVAMANVQVTDEPDSTKNYFGQLYGGYEDLNSNVFSKFKFWRRISRDHSKWNDIIKDAIKVDNKKAITGSSTDASDELNKLSKDSLDYVHSKKDLQSKDENELHIEEKVMKNRSKFSVKLLKKSTAELSYGDEESGRGGVETFKTL